MKDLPETDKASPKEVLCLYEIRVTPSRIGVLEVLQQSDHALTAEELYNLLVNRIPGVGRATVYRNIALLEAKGLLKKVHQEKECHGYFLSRQRNGHFITCQNCGIVQEIPCGEPDNFFQAVRKKTGFHIIDHLMGLSGMCPQCR
ncbi:MAG TPA: Fur family transcriptional regulator [Atribacteraceae bacterium]|nr:Fur family transcriptional regulator [Atribacteraceae bacterium]